MKSRKLLFITFLLLLSLSFAACVPQQAESKPAEVVEVLITEDTTALRTEVAQTVEAEITIEAALTIAAMPANTEAPPTEVPPTEIPTEAPAAAEAAPTNTAQPAPTYTVTQAPVTYSYPTSTPTYYTDRAELSGQNPVDGTYFSPGQGFDLVFTIKNVGMRPWNGNFYLKYVSGVAGSTHDGNAITMAYVPGAVAVGDSVTLTIDMIAPTQAGTYSSNWVLINDDGTGFFSPNLVFSVQ